MTTEPGRKGDSKALFGRVAFVLSALSTFALFALVVGPGVLRQGRSEPASSPGAREVKGAPGWFDPAEAPPRKGRVLPPIDPNAVLEPRPKLLERGQGLYRQHCVSCHGAEGKGDGPAAPTLSPRPRDFTRAQGWTHGYRITEVFNTVTSGVKGTGMSGFEFLPPTERMALVQVVRSMGPFDHGREDPAALAQLKAQLGTSGGKIPNRIPVSLAIRKLVQEARPVAPLSKPSDPREQALFRALVADPERAGITLDRLRARNDAELVTALGAGAPSNGFRPEVATLGLADWQLLRRALFNQPSAHPEG
jgi:mono/diheme cytochrome c family protein